MGAVWTLGSAETPVHRNKLRIMDNEIRIQDLEIRVIKHKQKKRARIEIQPRF